MKTLFPEQFPITENSLSDIWDRGIMVFDTNTLLRLYRYKKSTSDEILKVWEGLGDRLWIPYQVAWEYNNNRLIKIKEARKSYTDIVGLLKDAGEKVAAKLAELKDFGVHPDAGLEGDIGDIAQQIIEKTEAVSTRYDASPTGGHYASIHENIGNLFEGKIGDIPTSEQLSNLFLEGQSRFERSCPPGLRDVPDKRKRQRPDREVFGDYIVWDEIIRKAKQVSLPVIFVTEDAKDDWWLKDEGKTIGILPELRAEFIREVNTDIHFYRIGYFLEQAKARLAADISKDSVEDIARIKDVSSEAITVSSVENPNIVAQELSNLFLISQWENQESDIKKKFVSKYLEDMAARAAFAKQRTARSRFIKAKNEYHSFSKIERSASSRGIGTPNILAARENYLKTKKEYEDSQSSFSGYIDKISLYPDDISNSD